MTLRETIEYLIENGTAEELAMVKSYLDGVAFLTEAGEILEESAKVETFTDSQLAGILYENGYIVDEHAIASLREDIETGAVIIGPDIPDAKSGREGEASDLEMDNDDIEEYTDAETVEDLKAVVVEQYNALFAE